MPTPASRSILIEHIDGSATMVEEIPANAKITFGPVQPGGRGYGPGENVLRIYTSASNQLAVFRNVASFRDMSLNVRVREVTEVHAETSHRGPDGATVARLHDMKNGPFTAPDLNF